MNQLLLDTLAKVTQVAKHPRFTTLKEKIFLLSGVIICLLLVLTSFMPKHKTKTEIVVHEEEDTKALLHQNMAYISTLQETPKPKPIKVKKLRPETLARMNAPSTFFSVQNSPDKSPDAKAMSTLAGHDPNADFLNHQNDITSVQAKQLPHPTLTIPAGEMIPATLETAINSELAGMARAVTARDIYALEGNKLLIPKGSTLVGQFNSAVNQGQNRIFVVWNRVQLSNGVIVSLASPSTDAIGRAGSGADYIDRHFFERFGTGTLLSVLGAYSALGGVKSQDEYNSLSQYRMNIANSLQQAGNQTFTQDLGTRPTLQVNQGTLINVFVAHDLDFYGIAKRLA